MTKPARTTIKTEQIRILLEAVEHRREYSRLEEQWENEGGAPRPVPEKVWSGQKPLPLNPGDTFRVLEGHIEEKEGKLYYLVKIEKIDS